jgi:hypothetical protein
MKLLAPARTDSSWQTVLEHVMAALRLRFVAIVTFAVALAVVFGEVAQAGIREP